MKPRFNKYPIEIRPLTAEEGGEFLATFPDLPDCMAEGETPEETVADARGAFECWTDAHIADGHPVPMPGIVNASGKFVQPLPRTYYSFTPSISGKGARSESGSAGDSLYLRRFGTP